MRTAAVLLAAAGLSLAQGEAPLFEESFGGKLSEGWSWVREDAASWKVEGGALRISPQPGTIWFKTNNARNLLLRTPPASGTPEAPVAVEVEIDHTPAAEAEQSGLLFYVDDGNYLKLVYESLKGKTHVVFAREAKGIPAHLPTREEPSRPVRLRLLWSGPKIAGQYRPAGGTEWITVGEYDALPGQARVGLMACGAPAGTDRWASFRSFRVVRASR
jgi:regulation of enolase protein 1 (concanavalin A-like superfamily)